MNAKKILFPTDFSTSSDGALDHAAALASESGATLLIVHVEEPPMAYGMGDMYYGVLEPDREALMGMLMTVAPKNTSVPVERRLLIGNPADEIVKVAHDEHVDMIVMGTHGRTGWQHMLMGSVAEVVVRKAECPVLTLRMSVPAKAAT